jgi:fructose-bisphosphate aldolase class I
MTTYFNDYPKELQEELAKIANAIVAPGKGILAADESTATCGKRFAVSATKLFLRVLKLISIFYF